MEGTGKHGLPESSHSSTAYLKMNPDGTFNMTRVYDSNHNLRLEIGYHVDSKLAEGKGKVLHYHIYDTSFSKTTDGKPVRPSKVLHKNSKTLSIQVNIKNENTDFTGISHQKQI